MGRGFEIHLSIPQSATPEEADAAILSHLQCIVVWLDSTSYIRAVLDEAVTKGRANLKFNIRTTVKDVYDSVHENMRMQIRRLEREKSTLQKDTARLQGLVDLHKSAAVHVDGLLLEQRKRIQQLEQETKDLTEQRDNAVELFNKEKCAMHSLQREHDALKQSHEGLLSMMPDVSPEELQKLHRRIRHLEEENNRLKMRVQCDSAQYRCRLDKYMALYKKLEQIRSLLEEEPEK